MQKYCDTAFECYIFVSLAVIFSSWKPLFLHLQPSFSEMVQKANRGFWLWRCGGNIADKRESVDGHMDLCGRQRQLSMADMTAYRSGADVVLLRRRCAFSYSLKCILIVAYWMRKSRSGDFFLSFYGFSCRRPSFRDKSLAISLPCLC